TDQSFDSQHEFRRRKRLVQDGVRGKTAIEVYVAVGGQEQEWDTAGGGKLGGRVDVLAVAELDVENRRIEMPCPEQPKDFRQRRDRPAARIAGLLQRILQLGGEQKLILGNKDDRHLACARNHEILRNRPAHLPYRGKA